MYPNLSSLIYVFSTIIFGKVKSQADLEPCCYADTSVPHGSIVFSDPQRCYQLLCQNGIVIPRYVNQIGDKNCCEFNNRLIQDGKELRGYCMVMKCEAGDWKPTGEIEECCNHCYLFNDPHIKTLDGTWYDWHGRCNYSVAQTHSTTKPDIGIFSDFKACNGVASCLSHTTFRNDPNTIITLDNGDVSQVMANGYEYEVSSDVGQLSSEHKKLPVLAWKYSNCVFLLGSSRLLILHCPHRLDVWAHTYHAGRLNGLCGHYNGHPDDDFTDREGFVHTLDYWPMAYPQSWLTSEQSDVQCNIPCSGCFEENTTDPCKASPEKREYYDGFCRKYLQHLKESTYFEEYIKTCAFDLCVIYQNGGTETDAINWTREVVRMTAVVKDFI